MIPDRRLSTFQVAHIYVDNTQAVMFQRKMDKVLTDLSVSLLVSIESVEVEFGGPCAKILHMHCIAEYFLVCELNPDIPVLFFIFRATKL